MRARNPRMAPSAATASSPRAAAPRPWCVVSKSSTRVEIHLTGRPSRRASHGISTSSRYGPPFTPKPPPTSGAITRTRSGARPSSRATSSRIRWGTCVEDQMVSAPFSQRAATARGSSGTPASRVWRTSSATTRWAAAKARSGSPVLTVYVKQRLSSRPITGGAPAASAASGSATPGSGGHARVSVRASHEDDVGHAVDPEVVEEPALAAQQRRVLAATRGAADVGHGASNCTITPMPRAWGGIALAAALLGGPADAAAQVFIDASSRPDFTIGPLFVAATAPADASAPVGLSVTWNLVQRHGEPPTKRTLALFWPAEIAGATAPGPADPALVNHLESRGFSVTASGRLALRARSQSQLGLPTPADDLPVSASYVSFVRRDRPPQAGTGSLVWIPPTPQMGDQRWVLNLTLPMRGLIGPKPATWLEELFWGRRNPLALSWGDVGSIAFYPLYHEHRDRIVHLAREYSRLFVNFPDADHLRIEQIEPAAATRRASRFRAGTG